MRNVKMSHRSSAALCLASRLALCAVTSEPAIAKFNISAGPTCVGDKMGIWADASACEDGSGPRANVNGHGWIGMTLGLNGLWHCEYQTQTSDGGNIATIAGQSDCDTADSITAPVIAADHVIADYPDHWTGDSVYYSVVLAPDGVLPACSIVWDGDGLNEGTSGQQVNTWYDYKGAKSVHAHVGSSQASYTETIHILKSTTDSWCGDPTRTTLGLGEGVTIQPDPGAPCTWELSPGTHCQLNNGAFTAGQTSEGASVTCHLTPEAGAPSTLSYEIVAPAGSDYLSDLGFSSPFPLGSGSSEIGTLHKFSNLIGCRADVDFLWAELFELVPAVNWQWPNGTPLTWPAQTNPYNISVDCNIVVDYVGYPGPYPIYFLNGSGFGTQVTITLAYKNDEGNYVAFDSNSHSSLFTSDGTCSLTVSGSCDPEPISAGPDGPWQ